jgi:hypothetical protein
MPESIPMPTTNASTLLDRRLMLPPFLVVTAIQMRQKCGVRIVQASSSLPLLRHAVKHLPSGRSLRTGARGIVAQ